MLENNELSDREREVLRLVATGASNKEIAQQLYISTNTVKVHLRNIFAKIGATSRTEATLYAIREGVVRVSTSSVVSAPLSSEISPVEYSVSMPVERPARRWFAHPIWWVAAGTLVLVLIGGLAIWPPNPAAQVSASPPASSTTFPRWQQKAPLPTARSGLAAAVYENQIYTIGGETEQGVTSVVERYDTSKNEWASVASKPIAVADANAATIRGKIYVPGGRLASGDPTDFLEVYDPRHDRWGRGATLPIRLSGYAMASFEGKLYIFGGWDGRGYSDSSYLYDPDQNTWKPISRLPGPRAFADAAVLGGKIYVIGGYDGTNTLRSTEEYLPERDDGTSNPWAKGADLPAGRYGMGVASIGGNIFVVGGEGKQQEMLAPLEYLPQQGKWAAFDSPVSRSWSRLVLVPTETQIYAFGGNMAGAPSTENLSYQAIYTIVVPVLR